MSSIKMNTLKHMAMVSIAAVFASSAFAASGTYHDAMRGPALKDVRLEGWLGAKMDRFISRRLVDPFMREQIFDEARQAFEFRDDDVCALDPRCRLRAESRRQCRPHRRRSSPRHLYTWFHSHIPCSRNRPHAGAPCTSPEWKRGLLRPPPCRYSA